MADDTQESDRSATNPIEQPQESQRVSTPQRKNPKHEFPNSQVGKLWDAFGSPEEPANILPEAKYRNSAELKKERELSIQEIVKSGNGISDIRSFHRTPCARDSLLLGLGAGFGLGGVRGIVGGILSILLFFRFCVYYLEWI